MNKLRRSPFGRRSFLVGSGATLAGITLGPKLFAHEAQEPPVPFSHIPRPASHRRVLCRAGSALG